MSVFRQGLFFDKVAIVTGGATGIGKAITEELASLGCKVIISSRNEQRLESVAKELCPTGKWVQAKACNIRKEDEVKNLIEWTIKNHGKIDYLVNNGGGQFPQPLAELSSKGWHAVIDTNLYGTFYMLREVFKQHMEEHGGVVVNIIADMFRGFPMMGHTGAARAAVDNLTKTLAIEWAENGVRVNAVAPGSSIYSPTASDNYGSNKIFDRVIPGIPAKRLGTPKEVSSAVCFLLSPGASFISGATLRIDAGGSLYSPPMMSIPEHKNLPAYDWDYKGPPQCDGDSETKSKL